VRERESGPFAPGFRSICLCALFIVVVAVAGCGARRAVATPVPPTPVASPEPSPAPAPAQPPVAASPLIPGTYVEQGIASWYGKPFDGRRAADGEVFDMNTLVAAHRTLPFGSIVRVTNLNNGLQTEVRIIDRGPFVEGRVLDLSRAAAQALQMIGTGTAPVRVELISDRALASGDFTVQVGAFSQRVNAERLRDRLLVLYKPVLIQEFDAPDGHYYRVRVGRVPTLDSAQQLAARLHANEGFETFVVRLDQSDDVNAK
jgi:peptidoglycan lytic transglycosylase